MDTLEKERAKWEAEHPNQDFDIYINNLIDARYDND